VIASMQPSHCTDDMAMAGQAVPAGTYSYPWRTLLDCGSRLVFGSDAPVSALEPLTGIHAAVSRQDAAGFPPEGFQAEQRITVAEALHAYTVGPGPAGRKASKAGCASICSPTSSFCLATCSGANRRGFPICGCTEPSSEEGSHGPPDRSGAPLAPLTTAQLGESK
jgi:hypothetical protein